MSESEVPPRLRIVVARMALDLGWALKNVCKPWAHRFFTTVRWVVPEIQRFLLRRRGGDNCNRILFEWLLSQTKPRIVAGLLVTLAFWGVLNFALRTTATDPHRIVNSSEFREESLISPTGNVINVSKFLPTQHPVLETGSISAADVPLVPLPLRNPTRVSNIAYGKVAKPNPKTQKNMVSAKKRPLLKAMP